MNPINDLLKYRRNADLSVTLRNRIADLFNELYPTDIPAELLKSLSEAQQQLLSFHWENEQQYRRIRQQLFEQLKQQQ